MRPTPIVVFCTATIILIVGAGGQSTGSLGLEQEARSKFTIVNEMNHVGWPSVRLALVRSWELTR